MAENKNSVKVEDTPNVEEDEMIPMGTAPLADIVTGNVPKPTEDEIAAAIEENKKSINEKAKEKLKAELAKATDKSFADPIIGYLLERCEEDKGLAEDVCQGHKTWKGCLDYIYSQAKKVAKNSNRCAVRNDVVFEWAEDYYHVDDKAEAKAKAKKEAESKVREEAAKKREEAAKKEKKTTKSSSASEQKNVPEKTEKKQPDKKVAEKKNTTGMTGQMSMFDFM